MSGEPAVRMQPTAELAQWAGTVAVARSAEQVSLPKPVVERAADR